MYHCAWPEVVWLPELTWRHMKWRHKTESGWFPLGCVLICSRCCVVLQGCFFYHVCVLTVVFLLNEWNGTFDPLSHPVEDPGLWLALYRGCINLLFFLLFFPVFFHSTCLARNNTHLYTIPVAFTAFSKSLVTSVMLCPAHRWMRWKMQWNPHTVDPSSCTRTVL